MAKMGRPPKYVSLYPNKELEPINIKLKDGQICIEDLADDMLEWFKDKDNYWLKDFAISKRMTWQRISELANINQYFSDVLKICKSMQESKFLDMGIKGTSKPAIVIFALKNVADWRDNRDITINQDKTEEFGNLSNEDIMKFIKSGQKELAIADD